MASTEYERGRARERERITAILGLPEALGRESLAAHIATESTLTLTEAAALLRAAPADRTKIAASWDEAMGRVAAQYGIGSRDAIARNATDRTDASRSWDAPLSDLAKRNAR